MCNGMSNFVNDDLALGFVAKFGNNMKMRALGASTTYLLRDTENGTITNYSELTFGAGHFNRDRYSSQANLETGVHYTHSNIANGKFFASAGVSTDLSYNKSYDQDVDYDLVYGPYVGLTTDANNQSNLAFKYGNHVENTSSDRTNNNKTFDIGVSADLAVGVCGDQSNTFLFGRLNKELTNKKNTTLTAGIGHTREFSNLFGTESVATLKVGYQHNFNKDNLTNNLMKHSGVFVEGSVSVFF